MTEQEQQDLDLDMEIAEEVMGWEVFPTPFNYAYYAEQRPGVLMQGRIPKFSTDRNAAHLVLLKIVELGLEEEFTFQFGDLRMLPALLEPPRNICVAALEAKRRQTEGGDEDQ